MNTNPTTSPALRFKVMGVNDDADDCACCGRTGLKRVVWIQDLETSEIRHYGTTCAANPAKAFGLGKEIKAEIANFESRQRAMWGYAGKIYRQRGGKYVSDGIPMHEGGALLPANKELMAECLKESKARFAAAGAAK